MNIAGVEVDAIWVLMVVCIAIVAISLVGLWRACLIERHYYRTRGDVRHT